MSSTGTYTCHPGLYLYVKYRGLKAAQHFSNFTDGCSRVFRDDLLQMKFALPKTVNTWLLAGGCVVGFWPDVSPDIQSILYKNLQSKIEEATEDRSGLDELSIHSMTLKERAWNKWNTLATTFTEDESPRPTKRRRYIERTPSPSPSKGSYRYDGRSSPDRGSPSQRWNRYQNDFYEEGYHSRHLPPPTFAPPPGPASVQPPTASVLFPPPTTVPPQANAVWSGSLANLTTEQKIVALRSSLSRLRADLPQLLTKDQLVLNELKKFGATDVPPRMKLVDEVSDAAKETELERLKKRVKTMEAVAQTQLSLKARLDETANKLQEEQQSRKTLEETAAAARQGEADSAKMRLEQVQHLLEQEARRCSDTEALLASARQSESSFRETYKLAKKGHDDLARRYARAEDELSLFQHNAESLQRDYDRVTLDLERTQQDLHEEKGRRRGLHDRLAISERTEAALRKRCDDAKEQMASLTRARERDAHDTRAAKQREDEALRLCQERSRRLEEVERSLEMERQMRREAEDAIADIRRECREPFVVPSLIDAFIELAKLTTAATAPGGVELGKNKGKEKASGSNGTPPSGVLNGGENWPREGHAQGYSPQYTPPTAHLPDVRMESPSQQVKHEQLATTWD